MEWTEEEILKLITSYKDYELLWNPKHALYHNKLRKNTAWEELAKELKCQAPEIKKKIESLLSSFRRERMKCITKSGCGRDEVYKSTWFAFNHMTFLLDKFQPRATYNTNTFHEDESPVYELAENQSDDSNIEPGEASISADAELSTQTDKSLANKTSLNIPRSKKRSLSVEETRVSEAYNILKSTVQANKQKDSSDIFADYVAKKHRKYNVKTQSYVEHQISNILFQADMEIYEHAVRFTNMSTHSTSSNSSHDDLLSPPSSSSLSPQILQPATALPIQTSNDNNHMYIISDTNDIQDIIKKYVNT